MHNSTYQDWRARVNAHFRHHADAPRWCVSYALAMLRHSLPGQMLWNEARDSNFWAAA